MINLESPVVVASTQTQPIRFASIFSFFHAKSTTHKLRGVTGENASKLKDPNSHDFQLAFAMQPRPLGLFRHKIA